MLTKEEISKRINDILYGAMMENDLMEKFVAEVQQEAYNKGFADGYAERVDENSVCE
jgi:hypothetical protein